MIQKMPFSNFYLMCFQIMTSHYSLRVLNFHFIKRRLKFRNNFVLLSYFFFMCFQIMTSHYCLRVLTFHYLTRRLKYRNTFVLLSYFNVNSVIVVKIAVIKNFSKVSRKNWAYLPIVDWSITYLKKSWAKINWNL